MKVNLKRILSVLLVVLVVLSCASLLFACNNTKKARERDLRERNDSVVAVKDAILHAIDEQWSASLSDEKIAVLDNAGDYIITNGWADMVCDVLKNSALQTGKLSALKNAAASEEGQKLLANFNENAELIIPIMRTANFTPTDISNIFYDLLCALASESGNTMSAMQQKLTSILTNPAVTLTARKNINECSLNLSLSKDIFVPTEAEKNAMLAAFANAKEPMSELISFAYNMSIGSITDSIFDALFSEDGALGNITDSEIYTIISTLLRSVTDLKVAFDDTAIKNLNTAIGLVIDKFDTTVVSSSLYAQVVQYAKYAFSVVDIIPTLCDVVNSAGKIFDDITLLGDLRSAVGANLDKQTTRVNSAILTARVLTKLREDFTLESINALIDKLSVQLTDDNLNNLPKYQKAMPVMLVDVAFNISAVLLNGEKEDFENATGLKHPEIIGEEEMSMVIGTLFLSTNFDNFKKTYADYKAGKTGLYSLDVATALCAFDLLGIENPHDTNNKYSESWYNYYAVTGIEQANAKISQTLKAVTDDIKAFASDFYNPSKDNYIIVNEIAAMSLKNANMSKAEIEAFNEKLMKSDMLGIVEIFSLFIKG